MYNHKRAVLRLCIQSELANALASECLTLVAVSASCKRGKCREAEPFPFSSSVLTMCPVLYLGLRCWCGLNKSGAPRPALPATLCAAMESWNLEQEYFGVTGES